MSYWYEPKKKDIEITEEGDEIHIHLDSNESGNIYVILKVKDIEELLNNLKAS